MLVATNYFTKWTNVVPLKNMTHKEGIHFILEHIVHRFDIPQTLTTNQGSSFMFHQVRDFVESLKIELLSSSPYYDRANGQPESSNKGWHDVLSEALWAHHISKHSVTKLTSI
jgi:hypothetical protein